MGVAQQLIAVFAILLLAACAGTENEGDPETAIDLPGRWVAIARSEADLNLAMSLPVKADSIYRRADVTQQIEEYYGFYGGAGVEGYVVTTRVLGGSVPEEAMLEMRQIRLLYHLVRDHPVTAQRQLEIGLFHGLKKDHPHTVGDYGTAASQNGQGRCFFARLGKLLKKENQNGSYPGAIDTVVIAVLCGDRIDENQMVTALEEAAVAKQ